LKREIFNLISFAAHIKRFDCCGGGDVIGDDDYDY